MSDPWRRLQPPPKLDNLVIIVVCVLVAVILLSTV